MAYNLESFSNWQEETVSDAEEAEDAGVNLAGARYQPSPQGLGRGGCAVHGWTASHRSADCNVLWKMDTEMWLRTAKAVASGTAGATAAPRPSAATVAGPATPLSTVADAMTTDRL